MKYRALFTLTLTSAVVFAPTAPAQNFTTGQAARLVIGQPTFTAQEEGPVSSIRVGAVSGLAYAPGIDTLFVVDSNRLSATPINHRVLMYRNVRGFIPDLTAELPALPEKRCPLCVGEASVVLGQATFDKGEFTAPTQRSLRTPVGIATDGVNLAVADTDNNRVLLWTRIPQENNTPADIVLGQENFTTALANRGRGIAPTAGTMRGPQGVWLQSGKLFVADTGNNRVLIWNSIPRSNGQNADVVLGAPDFETSVQPDLTKDQIVARNNNFRTPVAVTSDGVRLLVTDLGHNRVLIWNSIPTQNNAPASLVIGQKTFEDAAENNSSKLCPANPRPEGATEDTYPERCEATLEYPRFALSDGRYLFIADGGNDRVLVFNSFPTENGAKADAVLGQIAPVLNLISDNADPRGVASAGALRTPQALAFDGRNLFVADPFNRRVMVFTMAERKIPNTGVRNAASREVFAIGAITFSGEVRENAEVTLKIGIKDNTKEYKFKAGRNANFDTVVNGLAAAVNAGSGDPHVLATANLTRAAVILTARAAGASGNDIEYSTSVSGGDNVLVATTVGAKLSGGQDAALIAPGTIVTLLGDDLAETTASAPPGAQVLPRELAGVQVYFDGIRAPLVMVSPGEVRAQVPWEVRDSQSINAYIRTVRRDGRISVTSAIAVPVIPQNPGLFAVEGVADPRPGIVMHGSTYATGTVSVDGSVRAGDVATVLIEDRAYSYTVQENDGLDIIRNKLIELINNDPKVTASAASAFTRIRLQARVQGPEGEGIPYSARTREGDQVILTATTPRLCCANFGLVTPENPAIPGETIVLIGTGLGLVKNQADKDKQTGVAYTGPEFNDPVEFVSSLAGGKTANVISAGLKPGTVGLYEVVLELNSDIPTDAATQLTIAQDIYVSNIVTFPVRNPADDRPNP